MRTPILKFAENEHLSARFLYKEAKRGRLVLTKVGSRTFIDDADAAAWRALAPKVNGTVADITLQTAVKAVEALRRAVAEGHLERKVAALAIRNAAKSAGLTA
jgi:hypothetical protein